ncbi:hypothetical protein GCM10010326_61190 [Streptomyces xanthochromogenes]|uniref:Uncharacterized protein n=1 Tax=Streptomyces xanthochromogenes TaxID=67384 RepID=A0ABQ3ANF5_9ACTN|nr:hypothetical protein GCM10010326_61190 [Streptomyces xanthochromogenes]
MPVVSTLTIQKSAVTSGTLLRAEPAGRPARWVRPSGIGLAIASLLGCPMVVPALPAHRARPQLP